MGNLEIEFDFEELMPVPNVTGFMLAGTAYLEGDEDGFSVKSVALDGMRYSFGADDEPFPGLFGAVKSIIENRKHPIGRRAESDWSDMVSDWRAAHRLEAAE